MEHLLEYDNYDPLNEATSIEPKPKKGIGGYWDGKGHWIEGKPVQTPVKYDKGFDKCPCVKKQGWFNYDLNNDGSIDSIMPTGLAGNKKYKPNGVLEIFKSKPNGTFEVVKSTYRCSGDKVVDAWLQNPKKWITYKGNNPWVKAGLKEYIPVFTRDSEGQSEIKKIQQKLIDKKFLKIKKPTGNYGEMTKQAIKDAAKMINSGEETNIGAGITRGLYNTLMNH